MKRTDLMQCIHKWLNTCYRIEVIELVQLPLGADINASIYQARAKDQKTYFVKLKRGHVQAINIEILNLMQASGIQELIHPIKTVEGKQIQPVGDYTLIVYPFIEGQDGFSCSLTNQQWVNLGRALRKIHAIEVPSTLKAKMRQETFSSKWREIVRSIYANLETVSVDDEVAGKLRSFLQENKARILQLVDRSEELSQKACHRHLKFVLCHADIHGGNVLVNDPETFYIVDWDDPMLAPKERDLMFIGGGVGNVWNKPEEEKLFYQGYGEPNVDWTLLAYYRYERIVEDIAVYCQELLFKSTEGADRPLMYDQFMSQFEPNGVVDIAFATHKHLVG